ncbi:MAG: DUF2225 domain-containing protein [Fibrobacter sp.]|nr:DUF2225 domain-containing protein [Fibrobacter sp.]
MVHDEAEVKRRLLILMNDQSLVDEYISRFGAKIDIKHIKEIRDGRVKIPDPIEEDEIGDDPLFEIPVKCPVCENTDITCLELRAKSQQILQNKFLVPLYTGAKGFRTIDYTIYAVTVCPKCLFASPDRKDFGRHDISTHSDVKSQLSANCLVSIDEKRDERKKLLKFNGNYEQYFKRPRSLEAAIDSYLLSISRAQVEAWYEIPYSLYKMGAYSLRIAKILKDAKRDNCHYIKDALGYFEETFKTSNCPSEEIEMQVIYSITALYLKLGDQKKANSYIGVFNNLHNTRITEMRTKSGLTAAIIDKWADRAKYLWEDRDTEDLFKNE